MVKEMKPALLVIDIQRAWLDSSPGLKRCMEARIPVVNAAISTFRKKGLPIVAIYHHERNEEPEPGTPEFQFHADVAIKDDDVKIVKNYGNAFNKTKLEEILREFGCDAVVLCGLSATACVMATYVGAEDRDLNPYVLKNGIAGDSQEQTKFAEDIFDSICLKALGQIAHDAKAK